MGEKSLQALRLRKLSPNAVKLNGDLAIIQQEDGNFPYTHMLNVWYMYHKSYLHLPEILSKCIGKYILYMYGIVYTSIMYGMVYLPTWMA